MNRKILILFTILIMFKLSVINAQEKDTIVFISEQLPEYPGGEEAMMTYLRDQIKYPDAAREAGIAGMVIIRFVVEKDGSLSNFQVLKSVHESIDNEALRVVKAMPDWEPGKQRGKAVRVYINLPIRFILPEPVKKKKKRKAVSKNR
jgi:TonB family protein